MSCPKQKTEIYFLRVLCELLDTFNPLKKYEVIFEIYAIKVDDLNRFLLIEGTNQTRKKVYFSFKF